MHAGVARAVDFHGKEEKTRSLNWLLWPTGHLLVIRSCHQSRRSSFGATSHFSCPTPARTLLHFSTPSSTQASEAVGKLRASPVNAANNSSNPGLCPTNITVLELSSISEITLSKRRTPAS